MTKSIEQLRHDASLLMAEIRPLRAKLAELQHQHNSLATQIEAESRRQTAIRKIARGVSGRAKPAQKRPLNVAILEQFTNLPASVQAKIMAQLSATTTKHQCDSAL